MPRRYWQGFSPTRSELRFFGTATHGKAELFRSSSGEAAVVTGGDCVLFELSLINLSPPEGGTPYIELLVLQIGAGGSPLLNRFKNE